jgi:hypothetical protein
MDEIRKLLKDIMQLFQEKKKSKKIDRQIKRGRAHSVANEFEDRFARLLRRLLPRDYFFMVDYPITYKNPRMRRAKTLYPDIAIVKNGSLVGIFDLKIDLGYLSPDWVRKSGAEFRKLRRADYVCYNTEVGTNQGTVCELKVDPSLCRAIVLLTAKNDHGRSVAFRRQENCFILSANVHLNDSAINETNQRRFLRCIFNDSENQENWRRFADFLDQHFE